MVQLAVTTARKPSTDETLSNMAMSDRERLAEIEKGERGSGKWDVIIPNPKSRKSPRLCFFVTSLILVMVAAVVLVIVIKMSLSKRDDECCERGTETTRREEQGDSDVEKEKSLSFAFSWEMKRAFLELRQIMGDFKPKELFPVHRKDLPSDYIAYYEVKLEHKDGLSYAVISAGEKTGDYSLVETGGIPSPLDKLRDKAFLNGHHCSKFFRLTTDGITICEDHHLNRVVAATGDIYPKSPVTDWKQLDEQVSEALPRLKHDWRRLAKVSDKIKEWKISAKSTSHELTNSDQGDVTEKGLYVGEFTEIPVENVTEVRISFVGLSRAQATAKAVNISLRKWQTKLCKVLHDICDPQNPTRVRQDATTLNFAGSKYFKFGVNADENYVKAELENQEVRFQVTLNIGGGKLIVMRYGIVIRGKRLGRSVKRLNYEIPDEKLFPSIHYGGHCVSVRTMVSAWAMIFSYYDNLANRRSKLGYRRLGFNKNKLGHRFSTVKEKQNYIVKVISSKMNMKCPRLKRDSPSWDKTKLEHWFQQRQGDSSRIMYVGGIHKRPKATRKAINLLKKGIPVVISVEHEFTTSPRYGVVTRMRQRRSSYRHCDKVDCSLWEEVALTEFFVRDGISRGKWQMACAYYAAAALKE